MAEHFERELLVPNVAAGTGFGKSQGLRISGKIFAMVINDELVIKLSRSRADQIVAAGGGRLFDPGHGRLMKQWISVPFDSTTWDELVAEARSLVGSLAP